MSIRLEKRTWGEKDVLHLSDLAQLDFLLIYEGGYCSKHIHYHKYNLFHLICGKLEITLFTKSGEKKYILHENKRTMLIRPGVYHQFKALEKTECLEYSYVQYSEDDINRENEGGIAKTSE